MRHKMMINEFIGRCSSNKGWRAPVRTGSLAGGAQRSWGSASQGSVSALVSPTAGPWPWVLSLTLDAFYWFAPDSGLRLQPCHHRPLRASCSDLGGGQGYSSCRPKRGGPAVSPAQAS